MKFDLLADNLDSPRLLFIDCEIINSQLKACLVYVSMGIVKPEILLKDKTQQYKVKIKLHPQMLRLKTDIADLLMENLEVLETW